MAVKRNRKPVGRFSLFCKETIAPVANRARRGAWRRILRFLRNLVDAFEEWLHAEEVKFRESAIATPDNNPLRRPDVAMDRKASAVRERQLRQSAGRSRVGLGGARLKYQHGQFVRIGGAQ